MPAKLSTAQIDALRDVEKYGEFHGVAVVTKQSLEKRGLVVFVEAALTWALTDEGDSALRAIDGYSSKGVNGNDGPDDSGIQGVIVEPDHSDDDTQPLEPVQPTEPLKTTFELYEPTQPIELVEDWAGFSKPYSYPTRQQYSNAYRAQRLSACGLHDGAEVLTADMPLDIAVFAHQSHTGRPDPDPKPLDPFIVRAWYKRLLVAQKALSAIPLDDNTGFNNAVLDFKLLKARYMSLQELWQSRAEEAQSNFERLKLLWQLRLTPDEIPY